MNRLKRRHLARSARMATVYIVVISIALVILFPIYFLFSISLMSGYEAYYEWPLPLMPSLRANVRFVHEENQQFHLEIYNRSEGGFTPTGPVRFSSNSEGLEKVTVYMRRHLNVELEDAEISRYLAEATERGSVQVKLGKSILANYITFFKVTRDAVPSVVRSLLTAGITILISLIIGGMAGYAFARYVFGGKNALKIGVLFVRMFPAVAIAIPMVIILGSIGLYDRPAGLSLIYSVSQISLTVWIMTSIFSGISVEMEEAALIFGTTKAGSFFRITLPLALPGIAACAMYAFIGSWNEVVQAVVLTQFRPTFPVVVYQALVGAEGQVNLVTAGSIAQALPAVVFTFIIRKYVLRMWGSVSV